MGPMIVGVISICVWVGRVVGLGVVGGGFISLHRNLWVSVVASSRMRGGSFCSKSCRWTVQALRHSKKLDIHIV